MCPLTLPKTQLNLASYCIIFCAKGINFKDTFIYEGLGDIVQLDVSDREKIHPKLREQFCWIINFNKETNEEHKFVFELKVNMNQIL